MASQISRQQHVSWQHVRAVDSISNDVTVISDSDTVISDSDDVINNSAHWCVCVHVMCQSDLCIVASQISRRRCVTAIDSISDSVDIISESVNVVSDSDNVISSSGDVSVGGRHGADNVTDDFTDDARHRRLQVGAVHHLLHGIIDYHLQGPLQVFRTERTKLRIHSKDIFHWLHTINNTITTQPV